MMVAIATRPAKRERVFLPYFLAISHGEADGNLMANLCASLFFIHPTHVGSKMVCRPIFVSIVQNAAA